MNSVGFKAWFYQNLPGGDAQNLLEEIDPDWREHFHDPHIGLDFYLDHMDRDELCKHLKELT